MSDDELTIGVLRAELGHTMHQRDEAVARAERLEEAYNTCCENWADTRAALDKVREIARKATDAYVASPIPGPDELATWRERDAMQNLDEALAALEEA